MKNDSFKKFLGFEEREKLFEIKFHNFNIWEIARGYIFIEIDMINNKLQPLFPNKKSNEIKKTSLSIIKNSLKLFFLPKIDYLFLNNPRRIKQSDGKFYCIYTDLLIDLLKDNYSCVTFEDPYWALSPSSNISHYEPVKTENICYLDAIEYIYRFKKWNYKTFFKKDYVKLHKMLEELRLKVEYEFKCDLSKIFKVVEDKILYMILTYNIYKNVLKKSEIKAIFEFYDIFPSKIVINKIAKEMNIPIIEIQHGIVTKRNPIFLKYGDLKRKYDCLPDYVLSYGEKLLNKEYLPIESDKIVYIGSLFLDKKLSEYQCYISKTKNILFVSQSNIVKDLSIIAGNLADLLKNDKEYQIIYKMHPYEIDAQYECLLKDNIKIINDRNKDLYYYQSISIAQIGVYSTGIYEGLNFGLTTFILSNMYGFNEIKDIIKDGEGIYYVENSNDIYNIIKEKKVSKKQNNDYWKNVDKKYILKTIESIVNKVEKSFK